MQNYRKVLTDLHQGIWTDSYHVAAPTESEATVRRWSVAKRTLRGGPSDGIDVVSVDNGVLQFDVLPTRGMGLWRGAVNGFPLGWKSPVQFPVHPRHVDLAECGGLGWLRGFGEWMCRCGLTSIGDPAVDPEACGGPQLLPLHGRIANTPAHFVAVETPGNSDGRLTIRGMIDEAVLFGPKLRLTSQISTPLSSAIMEIADEVENLSESPSELQLMYHVNFGVPMLEEGARLIAPAREIAPYDTHSADCLDRWDCCTGPQPGIREECYFLTPLVDEQGTASVMLRNAGGDRAVVVSFPQCQLPFLTLWKHLDGLRDGYVVGLEPGTSFPNPKPFEREQGRVVALAPGETYRTTLHLAFLDDVQLVRRQEAALRALQRTHPLRVHATNDGVYCPTNRR